MSIAQKFYSSCFIALILAILLIYPLGAMDQAMDIDEYPPILDATLKRSPKMSIYLQSLLHLEQQGLIVCDILIKILSHLLYLHIPEELSRRLKENLDADHKPRAKVFFRLLEELSKICGHKISIGLLKSTLKQEQMSLCELTDVYNETVLWFACFYKNHDCVKIILEICKDTDETFQRIFRIDCRGANTPLQIAAEEGAANIIKILLLAAEDNAQKLILEKNWREQTALDLACNRLLHCNDSTQRSDYEAVIKILEPYHKSCEGGYIPN